MTTQKLKIAVTTGAIMACLVSLEAEKQNPPRLLDNETAEIVMYALQIPQGEDQEISRALREAQQAIGRVYSRNDPNNDSLLQFMEDDGEFCDSLKAKTAAVEIIRQRGVAWNFYQRALVKRNEAAHSQWELEDHFNRETKMIKVLNLPENLHAEVQKAREDKQREITRAKLRTREAQWMADQINRRTRVLQNLLVAIGASALEKGSKGDILRHKLQRGKDYEVYQCY